MAKNKRGIPDLRQRIREIADEENLDELHDIADEMHRNSPIRRAKNQSQTLTPELAKKIRDFAKKHPNMHQRDIAPKFNVNPGRVSQAMNNEV
ncbi:hypothetical protein [Erythrobacter crassostreae]|uniref:Uncharacterized protein n=1 Tax=Erythrobacter crassostreae TaxID=2828328 RepID=A0A9X1F2C5_9SPHN|nr:hypothetical protein [Erythrobacter crassostrea]MBV7258827.1 hypothetical protein [Erythrobacter crassostrea]